MTAQPSRAHEELATELKRLRISSGLSAQQLGERFGWSQSKVSKIENARTRPSLGDVESWAQACGTDAHTSARLATLVEALMTEARTWKARQGTLATRNKQIAEAERASTHVQNFQPAVVPGLLQTAEYARRVISLLDPADERDVAAAVAARVERQTILYDQGKRFEFFLTEGALRWRPGPSALTLAQLDRLLSIATLTNVTIGVLPFSDQAVALYANGFTIFDPPDDPFVLVETYTQELRLHDQADLDAYRRLVATLRESAAVDDAANEVIRRIMAESASE